jgi:hypothetical protein
MPANLIPKIHSREMPQNKKQLTPIYRGGFVKLTKINRKFMHVIVLGTRGLIVSVADNAVSIISMAMHLKPVPMGWTSILFSHISFSTNCLDIFE